jgi:hypothetical protein
MSPEVPPIPSRDSGASKGRRRRRVSLGITVVTLALETLVLASRGYGLGGHVVVRCRQGHIFTTLWIPGASLKALRLGWVRFQRCPVGGHWTLVTPVPRSDLTDEARRMADECHDLRIP